MVNCLALCVALFTQSFTKVIDIKNYNDTEYTLVGNGWTLVSTTSPWMENGDYVYLSSSQKASHSITIHPQFVEGGTVSIWIKYPVVSGTTSVAYTFVDIFGVAQTASINQSAGGESWTKVGVFFVSAFNQEVSVTLNAATAIATTGIAIDSIKFETDGDFITTTIT